MKTKKLFIYCLILISIFLISCTNPFFMRAAKIYEVTFETNGGTTVASIKTDLIKKSPETNKYNCDFEGWYTNPKFENDAITFPFDITEDITLYAKWNQKYTVYFETNGGTEVSPITNSILDSVPQPSKSDCTFAGWYLNANLTGSPVEFPYKPTKDVTLYAKWLQKYSVYFETNGGNEIETIKTGLLTELPEPVRTNYIFEGWYLDGSLTGNKVQLPYEVTKNIILYAKWSPTYLVTVVSNGGSEVPSFRARVIESLTTPERSGYTFMGWYTDIELSMEASFPITLSGDITLYANWVKNYTVSFETNGGSAISPMTTGYIESSPVTTKKDCSFDGWYTTTNFTDESKVSFPYIVTGNVILYAKWLEQQVSLTYLPNGATSGTPPETVYVSKGSKVTVSGNSGNLEKTGYAFTKWYTSIDGKSGQGYAPGQIITLNNDLVLYAQWGTDYAEMVYIEGGTFIMGNPSSTDSYYKAHEVTLNSFYMSKYEITYELWYEVFNWAIDHGYELTNAQKGYSSGNSYTDFQPAINITWTMAIVWCNAYSEYKNLTPAYYKDSQFSTILKDSSYNSDVYWNKSSTGYQLPTEAQWEYAAGGGSGENRTTYPGTNSKDKYGSYAWYSSNSNNETHVVGKKAPNQLEIYDMAGNCWEWCYDVPYTYSTERQNNPVTSILTRLGYTSGNYHVIRGGDFYHSTTFEVYYRNQMHYAEPQKSTKYIYEIETTSGSLYYCKAVGLRLVRNYQTQ